MRGLDPRCKPLDDEFLIPFLFCTQKNDLHSRSFFYFWVGTSTAMQAAIMTAGL